MSRRCVICDLPFSAEKRRAREHVIPAWLLRELGAEHELITPTSWLWPEPFVSLEQINLEELQVSLARGPHPLGNFMEGRVCAQCNSRRLSSFEEGALPILVRLIRREALVKDLAPAESELVARWMLKTTLIFNFYFGYDGGIPQAHRAWLRESRTGLPEGVSVFAQQHQETQRLFWFGNAPLQAIAPNYSKGAEEIASRAKESYNHGLQLGALLLLAIFWPPTEGWTLTLARGVHIPLWYRYQIRMGYSLPPGVWPRKDSLGALAVFATSLLLVKRTKSAEALAQRVPIMSPFGPLARNEQGKYQRVRIGRNDFCPCGSGLKWKYCHGKS
jgi:hypothetical protein